MVNLLKSSSVLLSLRCGLVSLLLAFGFVANAQAEQAKTFGQYEIHYNAFNSSFITPKVAQTYGLLRSKRSGLLNVSILEIKADGTKVPTTAIISGEAKDLAGRSQKMSFKKVDEGDAIYYLGQFGFTDNTNLRFTLLVQADPNKPADTVTFEQVFFLD